MFINKLLITHYRNIKQLELLPSKNINIIYGNNAQGKTNLLEAIWLLTGGRSFRHSKDNELVTFTDKQVSNPEISAVFSAFGREQNIKITVNASKNIKRTASLNGVQKGLASNLIGSFYSTVFSPLNLMLLTGGPSLRRKFIDAAICQIKPSFAKLILSYNKTLNHKNAILKSIYSEKNLSSTIDVWDEKLASLGAKIIIQRINYCKHLLEIANNIHSGISQSKESLNLKYKSSLKIEDTPDMKYIYGNFKKALLNKRTYDYRVGATSVGPHRDDLIIQINNRSAKLFASQGQKRSVALALKLSEAFILKKYTQESPIILLDDIMSELDSFRQNYILNSLSDYQVFITCCDPNPVLKVTEGKIFYIKSGSILQHEEKNKR